jgi:hypothetical protein
MASKITALIAEISQNLFNIIDLYADETCIIRLEMISSELNQIKESIMIKMDNDLNQNSNNIERVGCNDESDEDMELINNLIQTEEAIECELKTPKLKNSASIDDAFFMTVN